VQFHFSAGVPKLAAMLLGMYIAVQRNDARTVLIRCGSG
jgi:hypothetical protein